MTNRCYMLGCSVAAALLSSVARAQSPESAAIPEMARLAKAFAGDWNTVKSCSTANLSRKARADAGPRT